MTTNRPRSSPAAPITAPRSDGERRTQEAAALSATGVSVPMESLVGPLRQRMRAAVSLAWAILGRRVGGGAVQIFKEANAQLQFSHILQTLAPLLQFGEKDRFWIECERTERLGRGWTEVDVVFAGVTEHEHHIIAIEMKVYRKNASSGKARGAQDIFRKDCYKDLAKLESYVDAEIATEGVSLIMTDYASLTLSKPYKANQKWWHYDIAHEKLIQPGRRTVPAGSEAVDFTLTREYLFRWVPYGEFWFAELQVSPDSYPTFLGKSK